MKIRRVLAYGLPVMKNMAVIKVCNDMKVEFRLIKPEQAHFSLGFLAGIEGFTDKAPQYDIQDKNRVNGEFLLFAGFDSADFDVFFSKYRETGSNPVELKAGLTEYNVLWSPMFLIEELNKEKEKIDGNRKS